MDMWKGIDIGLVVTAVGLWFNVLVVIPWKMKSLERSLRSGKSY